ncbi:putative lovastatin nonaketide synthase [Diaporthe ampelina]|uniref:Putative lovastatin nonaketide synthase n=1 Tax=Diaporthe ampelina TaxID=1214573 RepID=A0A0G2H3C4_9PEZI|nr:putative lovastatin nonaketide synthase [Diaporthe ampelina]
METIKSRTSTEIPYHGLLQRGKEAHVAFAEFLGFMCVNFGTSAVDIRRFVQQSSQPELAQSRLVDAPTYAWDHTQTYWRESRLSAQYHFRERPPHELLGVRTRDDNQFHMRWRNVLKLEQMPWVEGHKFQGQALLPASAYCIMVLDAAAVALNGHDASIVELQDLKFLSGITLEPGSLGVETLFTFCVLPIPDSRSGDTNIIEAVVTLTSVPITSSNHSPMKKNFEGKVVIILGDPSPDALPPRFDGPVAETLPISVAAFYQMMEGIGLSYTGPFQALRSIDRRLDYARGTLTKAHPLDTTTMDVSPAFLDSCFQATFATFSSPGDKALWTSFLPTKIGRMRFNPALCRTNQSSAVATVESYLTKFDHYSFGSPATITADLSVFNELGDTEVQLEELVVSSFSSAKPENDSELYLHTVMDVDPEYEIVTMRRQHEGVREHITESCERVAKVYLKQSTSIPSIDTPPGSPRSDSDAKIVKPVPIAIEQDIDRFNSDSPYFYALDLIRSPRVVEMSHAQPLVFPLAYQSIVDDAYLIHGFRAHLGRVVRQISHRFPRMDVLDLTFAEWAFTENLLDGLHGTFSSYRLMASTQPQYLLNRCPKLKSNKKVFFRDLDLYENIEDMDASTSDYDLVIMSTAVFSRFTLSKVEIVRKIRQLMRKRGFLIIVDAPPISTVEDRIGLGDRMFSQSSSDVGIPFDLDNSPARSMFLPAAENSTQIHAPGLSMVIRQADDELTMFKNGTRHESVVIVGHAAARFGFGRHEFGEKMGTQTGFEMFGKLEDITPKAASGATVVILLMDLSHPVCSNMTHGSLSALKSLMQPGKTVLWVTRATHRDPETAASLGLTRTLKAENPNLILQVLDFCNSGTQSKELIMDRMMLLIQYRDHLQTTQDLREKMLFSFEPEIHVNGKRQIVPRVLPYQPAIERLNASRREVTEIHNSLETCLVIGSAQGIDGVTRFEVRRSGGAGLLKQPTGKVVNVEFSSLYPISTGQDDMYLCVGLAVENGRPVAGISPYVVSKAPTFCTVNLPEGNVDRRRLASWLAPMVSVADLATLAKEHADTQYIHPLSSGRELKRLIPRTQPTVIDFLRDGDDLSKTLEGLAGDFKMVGHEPSQNPSSTFVTPALLQGSIGLTRDLGQSLCRLFIQHGARNIVVASRSPNSAASWISELNSDGANIRAAQLDVTDLESVEALSASLPKVGGIVNGAMILDDRVFAQMDIGTWTRVMRPKTVGSSNLDKVFNSRDLGFFIMTSSFAAIGGHAGQSNYAAANMFMNGLAANRRRRGLVGSVLNIGVIYGVGLLARERQDIYHGLEREGYPPISERDIHHMFLEAIVAGRPTPGQIMDLTTGLARYRVNDPNPLHWHRDSRFCHFTVDDDEGGDGSLQQNGAAERNLRELIDATLSAGEVSGLLCEHFCHHLEAILQLSGDSVSGDSHIVDLGVDSLMAVEIRNWFYKRAGSDVPVMKILQPQNISECKCG